MTKKQDCEPKRCIRCLQTEYYPGVTFDSEGVCSNCRYYERKWPDNKLHKTEADFLTILDKARKKNPKYNAIVGFSGGKDSSYALHLLVKRYHANVLAITHDNGFLSEGARRNIDILVKALGVEHRYFAMDPALQKRVYQALIKNRCTDLCAVCMNGGVAALNTLALKERIPIIVMGTSAKTESVAIPPSLHNVMDFRYLVDSVRPHISRKELSYFKYIDLPWVFYFFVIRRLRYVMLPDFVEWKEGEIAAFLAKEYGWVDYGCGVPHFDCVANPVFNYFMKQRFNTSKMVEHLSLKIRCGEITREKAFEQLDAYHQSAEPVEAVDEMCRRLSVTRKDLQPYMDGTALDYRHFRGYTKMFQKLSWLFLLMGKLGVIHEDAYRKYLPSNDRITLKKD